MLQEPFVAMMPFRTGKRRSPDGVELPHALRCRSENATSSSNFPSSSSSSSAESINVGECQTPLLGSPVPSNVSASVRPEGELLYIFGNSAAEGMPGGARETFGGLRQLHSARETFADLCPHAEGDSTPLLQASENIGSAIEQRRIDGDDFGDDVDEQEEIDSDEHGSEEEEEDGEGDREEEADEEVQAPELAQLLSRVAELRQRALDVGGSELAPHLIRLRMLLEQVRDLHQGLDSQTVEANTLAMTLAAKPSSESPGDSVDAAPRQCMVCLEDFQAGDRLRVLPCFHRYHSGCVDNWFSRSRLCPVCKHDVTADDAQAIVAPRSTSTLQQHQSTVVEVNTDDEA